MPRHNMAFLRGIVADDPVVKKDGDEYVYATLHINVARSTRDVGDERNYMKCDNPVIITRERKLAKIIAGWIKYDVVDIKGTISTSPMKKASYCEHCGQRNVFMGALLYINPIYAGKVDHVENAEAGLIYLSKHREISNQAFVFGTLCRNPGVVKTKYSFKITQYQIAMARKYRIRTDPPEIRTDWPWVKSYGENAKEDIKRLRVGAEVYIDGCLQVRGVLRKVYCGQDMDEKGHPAYDEDGHPIFNLDRWGKILGCGQQYDWKERSAEIVPYETEYISGYLTDEELERSDRIAPKEEEEQKDVSD